MSISFAQTAPRTAFILSGGLGTRLRTVIRDVPKPMAPVAGRPFLEHLIHYWRNQGIMRFILSTGYMGEVIKTYFGQSYAGAKIVYVHEDTPLGTGGALAYAMQANVFEDEAPVLMLNGDTWFSASLATLQKDAMKHSGIALAMALLYVEDSARYGTVNVDEEGLITSFQEKKHGSGLINSGCYLIYPQRILPVLKDMPKFFSLEKDVLPRMAAEAKLSASIQQARFIDIGIPEDYARMQRELASFLCVREDIM